MSAENIPLGYKQTEVGVIPDDWEVRKLEEIADVIDPHPSHRAPPEVTNGIPFVGIGDLNENGEIIASKIRNVGPSVFDEHQKRYDLVEELIGLGRVASIGKVVKIKSIGSKYAISPTLGIIRGTKVKRDYLLYALKSKAVTDQFNKIMSGSTRSAVGMIVLRKLDIFLPTTKKEQEAIATALSDTDTLIESLEQLITKKRQIKQGAMQELLTGKRRLPRFEVKPGYKQTEVGVIPEDWKVVALESLGERTRPAIKAGPFGSSLTKDTYVAEGYKVYGQEQVIRGDYLYGDYYISKARFNELKSCAVEPGDILLSLVGTAGRVLVIPEGAPEGIINPRLIRFSFDRTIISPDFFKFLFETKTYQALLSRSSQGGTMGVLNAGLLRSLCIPLPQIAEQEAIATILSDMDTEITTLEEKLAKTHHIKQGMMQELLTGRIRLV